MSEWRGEVTWASRPCMLQHSHRPTLQACSRRTDDLDFLALNHGQDARVTTYPAPMASETRNVVGCMTGTSIDGIDAALVRVSGRGLEMRAEYVRGVSRPLGDLGPRLRALADQQPMTAGVIAALSREFAALHAETVKGLLREADARADLICVHGQTVFHAPPVSWQMFNGAMLSRELGVPVVFDLRAADLAAGGQGAPITPVADWVFFRSEQPTVIVNLGGFCNMTVLPAASAGMETIFGFDLCACNHVLDQIARRLLNVDYDKDGEIALSGQVHDAASLDLEGILRMQAASRRSLGTGDELGEWISRFRAHVKPADLAATACDAIGHMIASRVHEDVMRVLLAGGGARNKALVNAISGWVSPKVLLLDSCGVPIEFREAADMAVLGALCQDRVPITLPAVTGVREPAPVAGVWAYP